MRRLILTAIAAVAIAGMGSLAGTRAEAMPLPSHLSSSLSGLDVSPQTEQVRLVCNRVWNGYRWVRSCYETRRHHYRPHRHYRGHRHHHPRRGHHHHRRHR